MLREFIEYVEDKKIKVDSVILSVDGQKYKHVFRNDDRRNIRSISKVVSCLGVYKAIENELFDLESNVITYFKDVEIYNRGNRNYLSQLKIKHLLTLSIGHAKGLMLRKDYNSLPSDTDFTSYILNADISHQPGTFFVYNNGATYLLSAIIGKLINQYFDDWVYETVLKNLDIEKPKWDRSNQGVCLGATGLHLNNEEIHRIGQLLLNRGEYAGNRIIDASWVDAMHEPHMFNPHYGKYAATKHNKLNKIAYGYHIWVCGDGENGYPYTHYLCDGAEGQYLIVSPEQKMVMTILSRQKNTEPFDEILNKYLTY